LRSSACTAQLSYLVAISSMTSSRIILVMKSVSTSSMGIGVLGTDWPAPAVNSRTCSESDLGRRAAIFEGLVMTWCIC